MKIKISAIAKDESAYLSEWIYHHLVFGFTNIEIYVNNTSDNSYSLLRKISEKHPVKIINADALHLESGTGFQRAAYLDAYNRSKEDGTSYLMFLDIDEFWTPIDFRTNIKTFLTEMNLPDVVSFEWCFPNDEHLPFGRPYKESNKLIKNYHVKSIFNMAIDIDDINVHNVISNSAKFILSDGSSFESNDEHKYMVSLDELKKDIYRPYILHRVTRSQIEYVSLLGRGRPSTTGKIKDNRWGFISQPNDSVDFLIDKALVNDYNAKYASFISHSEVEDDINEGRRFVIKRFWGIVKYISVATDTDHLVLMNVLKNITLESVLLSMEISSRKSSTIENLNYESRILVQALVNTLTQDELSNIINEMLSIESSFDNKQSIPHYHQS
ncbi:glycosyltransferase family 2 protein [Aeromonas media]|uniref:glycosyltransferase family 2 protein n=1 Tax=Aeromonas media TaxID=651 RepID=UPI003D19D2F4